MKISITLPSMHPEALRRTLANIEASTQNEVEVLVCAPFKFDFPMKNGRVVWIPDRGDGIDHDAAIHLSTGTYITAFADDHLYTHAWDVEAIRDFEDREKENVPFCIGLRQREGWWVGTTFGLYYPYFPFMHSDDAKGNGFWFSRDFKKGFGDCDLGMRIWQAGGRCEWSREKLLVVLPEDGIRRTNGAYGPGDIALFVKRWKPVYGRGWDTSRVRGFNVDVNPERLAEFVDDGRTFSGNSLAFKAVAGDGG